MKLNDVRYEGSYNYDDVYMSYTQARVEIGNQSTFSACTKRELQIPTIWTNTSISLTANPGSFADGEQAYLLLLIRAVILVLDFQLPLEVGVKKLLVLNFPQEMREMLIIILKKLIHDGQLLMKVATLFFGLFLLIMYLTEISWVSMRCITLILLSSLMFL